MARRLSGKDFWRLGALVLAALYLAWLAWHDTSKILRHQPLGIDFLPMWAAGHEAFVHPGRIYDFVRLTWFQEPLLGAFRGERPFVYPPTALLAFAPFGRLPFFWANAIWTSASLVLILCDPVGEAEVAAAHDPAGSWRYRRRRFW